MKLLSRILLLLAVAAVVVLLAGDTAAAPSQFRPVLNRNGSLAYEDQDFSGVWFMHVDGSHNERFLPKDFGPVGSVPYGHPRWSPDGKRLAYTLGQQIGVINADGSQDTLLEDGNSPSWMPNGDLLYEHGGDIFRLHLPNGSPVNLTNTVGVDESEPAASPDGMWIAFSSFQDTTTDPTIPLSGLNQNLWIMNTTDLIASQSLLFEDEFGNYRGHPNWAPDSSRVAFADGGDIWTTPPNGNNPTNVTESDEPSQFQPSWSPDGKLIAFAQSALPFNLAPAGSPPSEIWTIDVDSRERTNLTNDSSAHQQSPDWQTWPVENGKIGFVGETGFLSVAGGSNAYIGTMTAQGEHVASLFPSNPLPFLQDIQYSPNGHQIALLFSGDTSNTIGVATDVGGFDPTWTGPTGQIVNPRSFGWFPDPNHMVWASDTGELFDILSGFNPVNLTFTDNITESQPQVSPDGKYIAFISDQLPFSDPPQPSNVTGLWRMDFDGLDRQFLATITVPQFAFLGGHQVSWSPDSSQIAYVSGSDVWTIEAEPGATPENQTNDSLSQNNVSWSPDGGLIAYDQGLFNADTSIWTIDPISGVRHHLSPDIEGASFALPTWQPLWAPNSDRYFVWGDTRCDGAPDILDLLPLLDAMSGGEPRHVPGCPWLDEDGLDSTGNSGPWGSTLCFNQLTPGDVIEFFDYLLDLGNHKFPPDAQPAGFSPDCPPIGSYSEFIPTG